MRAQKAILTEGHIAKALIKLALPIMGTSFMQMAYNLTDLYWVGKLGSPAVAAVGNAGFYAWLGMGIVLITKTGVEVTVSQSVGRQEFKEAVGFARNAVMLNVLLAVLYSILLILFRNPLIGFFRLQDVQVVDMSTQFLVILSIGMPFYFLTPVLTGIQNGIANSKIPLFINGLGLISNMCLDPIMIFGFGPIPALGIKGAAIATVIAQIIAAVVFIIYIKYGSRFFLEYSFWKKPSIRMLKEIVKVGLPVSLQICLFAFIAMWISRITSAWGAVPVAVQKVGSQIESISWMTAGGFSTALSSFVGQNFGAKKWSRIIKGYITAIGIMSGIGLFATVLLVFAAKPLFSMFINEENTIQYGVLYLKILGISQLFVCIEMTTAGAFYGLGKSIIPSAVSILLNLFRIPTAIILSSIPLFGLNGIWWSLSISSILKGIVLGICFVFYLRSIECSKKASLES